MKGRYFPAGTMEKTSPEGLGLRYTSFAWVDVAGDAVSIHAGAEEVVLAILSGEAAFDCAGESGSAVCQDLLYLPAHATITLSGRARIARFGAPCARKTAFSHVRFDEVCAGARHRRFGKPELGTARDVFHCIDSAFDSSRFLVGYCHGAPGGWTAWPPHEHGAKREEVYVYFGMGNGFALQCVYDDLEQADAVRIVRDGDVISVPGGYHPNAGCPGHGIRYLYCMVSVTPEDRDFMDLHIQPEFGSVLE